MKLSGPAVSWIARIAWLLVALAGGAAVEGAVSNRSDAVRLVVGIGGWLLWGIVMLALAVPSVRALTVARVSSPLAALASVATAIFGATAIDVGLLAVPTIVAITTVFTADFGRYFVQSSSYGDEERLPLRLPVAAGAAAVATAGS